MIQGASFLENMSMAKTEAGEQGAAARLKSLASNRPSRSFHEVLSERIDPSTARGRQKQRLKDACMEMESIFVARMLKEMRNTVHKNEWLHGGHAEEIFEDMLYDEYAKEISRNSRLGIADMLYRELNAKL